MSTFLFYLEPMPIRNSFINFRAIPRLFDFSLSHANEIGHDFFIYSNIQTLKEISLYNSSLTSHFVYPTYDESKIYQDCMCDWESQGIRDWLSLYSEGSLTRTFVNNIKAIYKRQKFDYIICWGTNVAVKIAAKELNVGFINMELGCSRSPYKDSLVADPWGVNGSSAISKSSISDFYDISKTYSAFNDLVRSMNFHTEAYEQQFSYVENSKLLNIDHSVPIFYIPLQLFDDANMLAYSDFDSVEDVVKYILDTVSDKGICIFKEHPASAQREGSKFANIKAKLYACMNKDNVIWLSASDCSLNNVQLFNLADCVVTVNSSVGFEALYYDKPVVVLGEAVYKVDGVFPSLNNIVEGTFDYSLYQKNISYIRSFFLDFYLFSKEEAQDPEFLFNHLKFVGDLSKMDLSVSDIVKKFIERKFKSEFV